MADTTTRTLLLNFKSDTKSILDLGVLFAKVEEQAKGMLSEQEQALNKLIAKTDSLAKAKEKSNKEQAKLDAQEAKAAKDREAIANREFSLVERRLAQTKALEEKKNNEALSLAGNQGKAQLNAQASYAKQKIKDEEDLANKTRQITLNSLKQTIEERNGILNAASKQRLGNAIGDITSAESSDRKKLLASLRQDMTERAKLQQEEFNLVERGLQQTRTREAERAKIEEAAARQRLERQAATNRQLLANETDFNERQRQNQLRGMRTSATATFSAMPVAGRLAPIPRIPEDVRSGYDSLFARIGAINIEYRLWNTLINTVTESLRGIPRVGIELDSVKASLESTMGSTAGMNSALKALDAEAQRTGINVGVLRDNFKGFQASTSLAGVSLDSTWRMFTNLNTVITGLHLSADKANHVFLAMSQIFNKSKVQSEELVKQLGNLLPGAFASFAASMKIAPEELAKQMKAGTVYAQDTMENFIQYMATKFAPAFAASIDNLNANIGRMQTSFTHLQEAIYEKSAPAMNAFVKSITSGVDAITGFVKGTAELEGWLKGALYASIGLVSASLITLTANVLEAVTAAKALQVAMAFFNPEVAIIAAVAGGVTYLTSEFYKADKAASNLRNTYADINKLGNSMRGIDATTGKSPAEVLKIRVAQDKDVITASENLAKAEKELANSRPVTSGRGAVAEVSAEQQKQLDFGKKVVEKAKSELELAKSLAVLQLDKNDKLEKQASIEAKIGKYKGFQEEMEYQSDKYAKTSQEAVDRALKKFEESSAKIKQDAEKDIARYKSLQAKPGTSSKDELDNARKVSEEATKALAGYEERKARTIEDARAKFAAKGESASKKAAAAQLKATKEEIGIIREYQRTAANDAKTQIDILNADNKAKILSFEEYARRKQEILDKDYNAEKKWYEDQKALAEKSGKKGLITKADEELKRLEQDYQSKSKVAGDETTARMNDYETNLASIHQQYQDILGIERDSVEITKVKLELLNRQIEAEIKEGGEVGAKAERMKEEVRLLVEAQNLTKNISINRKNLATAEKIANDALRRNEELKNAGQLTDLQYAMSNTKIKERQVALSEKEVASMKEKLDAADEKGRPAAQSNYDIAVQKLESLKLVANETGAMIEQSLGNAFEGAFNGLITKSMTARQAFASFTNSILSDIAKIIAQEMRSQILGSILKPLASAAWGGLTSAFGSSAAASTAGTVGGINMNNASLQNLKLANGGVVSGAGISAHSGTIVSSPTVFPFAKGVGLMGEAGPEAILPLKRNAQGKLGISAENTGHSNNNLYNITVNVEAKQGESASQFGDRAAQAIIRSIAKEEISNARRPGNTLNKSRFA